MRYRTQTLLYAFLIGCILFIPNLFVRGLWAPDEPRYAEISRQVARSDNLLMLQLNGELYPEKPPLFFYAASLGDSLWAPYGGKLVAIASVIALGMILQGFFQGNNSKIRLRATIIFFCCTLSFVCGKFGIIDGFLVLFLVLAVYHGRAALSRERPVAAWLGCYTAIALGTLVKGPVLIPFALLALVGSFVDIRLNAPKSKHILANLLGLAVFLSIVLAWLIPACISGGEEYTNILVAIRDSI